MSYKDISSKHVVGRKQYICVWCDEDIPRGKRHLSRFYKMEGDTISDRMHIECERAMIKMPHADVCDGFTRGEFKRGTCEQK